jgi:hypothetical protein
MSDVKRHKPTLDKLDHNLAEYGFTPEWLVCKIVEDVESAKQAGDPKVVADLEQLLGELLKSDRLKRH